MKTRIATALSVAGVLFAGSAAALVNTQVLGGHDSSPADSVLESPSSTAPTARAAVVTSITARPVATPAATIAPVVPSSASSATPAPVATTAPAPMPAAYAIGESGTVELDSAGGALVVVSVTPAAGWQVVQAEPTGPTTIRVILRSDSLEVTFDAALDGTAIVTAVDARSVVAPETAPPTATSRVKGGDGDDDRDDDHDDRDHEGEGRDD